MADDSTRQEEQEQTKQTNTDVDESVLEMFDEHEQGELSWEWNEDDDVDPELVDMAPRPQSSILRPILMITVLVMGALVIKDRKDDLSYFFSETKPIEVGKVIDFATKREKDPKFKPNLVHNRYVSLEGIPSKRSVNERYRYTKLVGGDLYLEIARKEDKKSALDKILQDQPTGSSDRAYFKGSGRALDFSKIPHRYKNLRLYYGRHYNTTFCVDLTKEQKAQRLNDRRVAFQTAWKKRYAQATPEQKKTLTETPTEAQIKTATTKDPLCTEAFIIQAGVNPRSHWWYVVLCGIIALFMVVDTLFLIRWIRDFLTPDDL